MIPEGPGWPARPLAGQWPFSTVIHKRRTARSKNGWTVQVWKYFPNCVSQFNYNVNTIITIQRVETPWRLQTTLATESSVIHDAQDQQRGDTYDCAGGKSVLESALLLVAADISRTRRPASAVVPSLDHSPRGFAVMRAVRDAVCFVAFCFVAFYFLAVCFFGRSVLQGRRGPLQRRRRRRRGRRGSGWERG